jgi:pimeloyl-ACP methyl ester carboxylesterase
VTLGLAYAQRYPGRVTEMVLVSCTMTRPGDVPWLLHRAWPGSELHLVRTGHQGGDEMTEHMMTALNRFART